VTSLKPETSDQRPETSLSPANSYNQKVVWIFLILLFGIRAWFNAAVPLSAEEAYYWAWSRQLDLCYFDHPPLIAWMIRFWTMLFGHSVFAARAAALMSHFLTAIIIYLFTRRISGNPPAAAWASTLFTLTIFFAVTATAIIPDAVLFLFWMLTLWLTVEAMKAGGGKYWVFAGVTLGLAALAKFHAIFLALAIGMTLIISPRQRRHFKSPWFYICVFLTVAVIMPIFIWNAREGWVTFGFQLSQRDSLSSWSPVYMVEMLIAPFGYVGPIMFPLIAIGTLWGFRQGLRHARDDLLFLAFACATPFLCFFVLSIFITIDPQWAVPSFVAGIPLAALFGLELRKKANSRRWKKGLLPWAAISNGIVVILGYGLVLLILSQPMLIPRDLQFLEYRRKQIKAHKIGRFYGWEEIGQRLRDEINYMGGPERTFIYSRRGWTKAAHFAFYAGQNVRAYIFDSPPEGGHQFYIWEP
jgi:4-amino-4-deoxy-L-arabinose transferase-like glycosyltransferase